MIRQLFSVVLALGLLTALAVAPASAQGNEQIKAKIPFNFTVGKKTLPAGEYTLTQLSPGVLKIHGEEAAVLTLAMVDSGARIEAGKLVFNRYASQYFLSQLDVRSGSLRYTLPTSSSEKKLRRSTSDHEALAILTRNER
jgi:hypothetical protein